MISFNRDRRLPAACLVLALCVCCTSHLGSKQRDRPEGIVVASFNFPESVLLGDIYAQALRAGGYRVSVLDNAGPREIIDPSLVRGLVDLVPEYTGSALVFFRRGTNQGDATLRTARRALTRALAAKGLDYSLSSSGPASTVVFAADSALSFVSRTTLVRSVWRQEELSLCGAEAPCRE